MKTIDIKGSKRSEMTKQAIKSIRENEEVPCVLYGGAEPIHFSAPLADFKGLVYTPEVHMVNIDVDGKTHLAILQDIQFHPVTDIIQHVDFLEVAEDRLVTLSIPVKFTGASDGVKQGGKLVTKVRRLKVKALPKQLPDHVMIDITPLKIGGSIRVRDLQVDGVTFLDSPSNVIVGVRMTRNVAATEATPEKK